MKLKRLPTNCCYYRHLYYCTLKCIFNYDFKLTARNILVNLLYIKMFIIKTPNTHNINTNNINTNNNDNDNKIKTLNLISDMYDYIKMNKLKINLKLWTSKDMLLNIVTKSRHATLKMDLVKNLRIKNTQVLFEIISDYIADVYRLVY